jgi:pyrroloquinoline quinone biosynthesis protein B
MASFLADNGPWSLLVETGAVQPVVVAAGETRALSDSISVTPLAVPHREEFTDTYAWLIEGPRRTVLYLPDIDKWERWVDEVGEPRLASVLADVDVALVDGTFHADGEIPGRDMRDIPHPFLVETIAQLASRPASERAKIVFTHLNHTNPAADPDSAAARAVRTAGMRVAREGEILEL